MVVEGTMRLQWPNEYYTTLRSGEAKFRLPQETAPAALARALQLPRIQTPYTDVAVFFKVSARTIPKLDRAQAAADKRGNESWHEGSTKSFW